MWEARGHGVRNAKTLRWLSGSYGAHDIRARSCHHYYLKSAICVERRNLVVRLALKSGGVCGP